MMTAAEALEKANVNITRLVETELDNALSEVADAVTKGYTRAYVNIDNRVVLYKVVTELEELGYKTVWAEDSRNIVKITWGQELQLVEVEEPYKPNMLERILTWLKIID